MKILYPLVVFIFLGLNGSVLAQNYSMPGGTINTCSGTFYDTGGNGGNYNNSANVTTTFCSNASNCIRIAFSSFNIENNFDYLYIYI
ncbi:MAG: hypothetical protein M3Q58_16095 [Bacteroidota bacterium]|nr:hypothetical protein [Bacteroidota bacterium]